MLLSIVTPSLNQAGFLAGLIENVRAQGRHDEIEHIVVDGGSTDGTLELLRSYEGLVRWVSEPDGGQSHAINKGMSMARGDVRAWINCDDRYSPGAVALVRSLFARNEDLQFVYGDALGVDLTGRDYGLRAHVRACTLGDLVHEGDPIVQPAAFWRASLWRDAGELNEEMTYAFDYEYWMRIARIAPLTYLPVCLAVEALHGEAKTSRGDDPRMTEITRAARRFGGEGVPQGFRAEAAALETRAVVRDLLRGDVSGARRRAARVRDLRASPSRFAAHVLAQTLPGTSAVPRMRLVANRLRALRVPVYPSQVLVETAEAMLVVAAPAWTADDATEAVAAWEQ